VTQDRWARIKDILGTALELPNTARLEYLTDACGMDSTLREEVEALLASSEDADDFIEKPALASVDEWDDREDDADSLIGVKIGNYRILQLLGEGGMGAVYRAIRDDGDFPLQVAIKVVKRGMDTHAILRRFREERRILARLNHPNIAKLLDGGITPDGRPYFVMEFLEGTPIHTYCRTNDVSLYGKLELFIAACDAVEYSHRNLVVHRDLKASNILVTAAGVPKLLDFGIAKLIDRDTATAGEVTAKADRLMTPDYASPEQIQGEAITTATDVYSLGVLLYELLTGRRPFQMLGLPQHEMGRVLATTDPPRPSSVVERPMARELSGDLDTIVLKAIHRNAERRYSSVQQFADDIRRYMDGRTVLARPDTLAYRAGKLLSRNKGIAITAALSAIAVFVSGVVIAWQSGVAESRRQEAKKRFSDLRHLATSFVTELDKELERLPGSTPARELLVERVLRYLDALAKDDIQDNSLQRELAIAYERLADVQGGPKSSNLGNSAGALESYNKALAIYERLAKASPSEILPSRDTARAYSKISDVLSVTGDYRGALDFEKKALAVREAWLAQHPNDPQAKRAVAASLQEVAGDLDRLGDGAKVAEYRRKALNVYEELFASGVNDRDIYLALALAHKRLGRTLTRDKRFADAIPSFDKAVEIEKGLLAMDRVNATALINLSFSYNDKGRALYQVGDYKGAMAAFGEALKIRSDLVKADPKDVRVASLLAATQFHMGVARVEHGEIAAGMADLRQALESRERLTERDPKNLGAVAEVAQALAAIGDAYMKMGRKSEALGPYERARSIYLDLRSRGSLSAEFAGEPDRLTAEMAKIVSNGAPKQPRV
jgi:non-specific serine/threonine protein kinase/serine/threonine-protein kinase